MQLYVKVIEVGVFQIAAVMTTQPFFHPDRLHHLPFGNNRSRRLHPDEAIEDRLQLFHFLRLDVVAA